LIEVAVEAEGPGWVESTVSSLRQSIEGAFGPTEALWESLSRDVESGKAFAKGNTVCFDLGVKISENFLTEDC
jgi:hypothetical protein